MKYEYDLKNQESLATCDIKMDGASLRSRPLATAKTRSRGVNSIKLKSLRDLATYEPSEWMEEHYAPLSLHRSGNISP